MKRKGMSEDKHTYLTTVRPGYDRRRPEEYLEQELADELKRSVRRPK